MLESIGLKSAEQLFESIPPQLRLQRALNTPAALSEIELLDKFERLGQRNALRAHYALLRRLEIPKSGFHRLRHTFATSYLQNGGDVVRLSRVLGHSQITTTMRYLHLVTTDLQKPHQQLSILNRLR